MINIIKILMPSIIIAAVFILSIWGAYKLLRAKVLWKKCLALFPLFLLYIIVYGLTFGFWQLNIKEVTYESPDIPEAFDGYKIVQVTDVHCGGSFWGPYKDLVKDDFEKINALQPDLICMVGDIQHFLPSELEELKAEMSSLKAKDGVLSVMGNHDYCSYSGFSPARQAQEIKRTRNVHRSFGWKMLSDEHFYIHRDSDSILVVGEENWGLKPFPQVGDIKKAIKGVAINPATKTANTFSLCLSHDPNAWKHHIMPVFIPNVTLAGHTHGAQFSIFGWHPIQYVYDEWGGEFYVPMKKGSDSKAMLSVSTGFGGNLPFRFGMPREVVVITLKKK